MFTKWFSIVLWLTIGGLMMAACEPALGAAGNPAMEGNSATNGSAVVPENGTVVPGNGTVLTEGGSGIGSSSPGSSGGAGQSGPGAAAGGGSAVPPGAQDAVTPSPMHSTYTDTIYQFAVEYPSNFVFRTRPAEKVAELSPRPTAAFVMLSPTMASSDVVDLLPADLDIRVYDAAGVSSLESWLSSGGLAGGYSAPEAFRTENVSGVKVCPSIMIGPGCSYLVMGDGFVYQLTPASLTGEAMLKTFRLIP